MKAPALLAWLAGLACVQASRLLQRSQASGGTDVQASRLLQRSQASGGTDVQESITTLLDTCLQVPQSLCFVDEGRGGSFRFGAGKQQADLAAWFTFDKRLPVDDSGSRRHLQTAQGALAPLPVGPGVLGRGASAAFDGDILRVVPVGDDGAFDEGAFTASLWMYLREAPPSEGGPRAILGRSSELDFSAPSLFLTAGTRHLQARFGGGGNAVSVESRGRVPLRRWTHLALASGDGKVRMYINGILDKMAALDISRPDGNAESSRHTFYLGRDPWRAGVVAYLDDFRWYKRSLDEMEIKALQSPLLSGSAESVHLACQACSLEEASHECRAQDQTLCSSRELNEGGYHVARSVGWLSSSTEVWHKGDVQPAGGKERMGLCCSS